jgi:hypothetical protein
VSADRNSEVWRLGHSELQCGTVCETVYCETDNRCRVDLHRIEIRTDSHLNMWSKAYSVVLGCVMVTVLVTGPKVRGF